jgi:hypothetical protein
MTMTMTNDTRDRVVAVIRDAHANYVAADEVARRCGAPDQARAELLTAHTAYLYAIIVATKGEAAKNGKATQDEKTT